MIDLEKFKISRKAQTSVDMDLPSKYVLSHGYLTTTRTKGSEKGGAVHVSVDPNENVTLSEINWGRDGELSFIALR